MTAFIIACLAIFFLSLISNIIFVLTTDGTRAGGIIGIVTFTAMIVWSCVLIF